jgi:hypothetical protein
VTKLRERISVSKRARKKFYSERFDVRKLDDVEIKEKHQIEKFDINNAWENIRENIKTSAKYNLDITGYNITNHGMIMSSPNYYNNGSRLN